MCGTKGHLLENQAIGPYRDSGMDYHAIWVRQQQATTDAGTDRDVCARYSGPEAVAH
jgi:hypothetical protein